MWWKAASRCRADVCSGANGRVLLDRWMRAVGSESAPNLAAARYLSHAQHFRAFSLSHLPLAGCCGVDVTAPLGPPVNEAGTRIGTLWTVATAHIRQTCTTSAGSGPC